MTMSKIQWDTMRDEARNAAVAVHEARKRFIATAPPADGSNPVTVDHERARESLSKARDAWEEKVLAWATAVSAGLDLTICDGEPEEDDELDQVRTQLAGCLLAAQGNGPTAQEGDYGWSPAYQAVLDLRVRYDDVKRQTDAAPIIASVHAHEDLIDLGVREAAPEPDFASGDSRPSLACDECDPCDEQLEQHAAAAQAG